jgi:hypothetical protein
MDKKIMKGLEANLDISLRAIKTQEKTIEIHKCHGAQLEKISEKRRVRIMILEATNKILHARLRDARALSSK